MIRKLIVTALIAAVWQIAFGLSLAAQVVATTANRRAKAEIRRQVAQCQEKCSQPWGFNG
jgi:hypothetical protein